MQRPKSAISIAAWPVSEEKLAIIRMQTCQLAICLEQFMQSAVVQ